MKPRVLVAWSILAFWLVTVGWHVKREYLRPETERLEVGARSLAPGTHFYVVRLNGHAIGTGTTRFDTIADTLKLADDLLLDVPALDTVQRAATVSRIRFDRGLRMRDFTFRLDSKIGSFAVAGVTTPDSMLDISVNAGGATQHNRIPANDGVMLDAAVPIRLAAAGKLRPGTVVNVSTFDPSALDTRTITVSVTDTDTMIVPDSSRTRADGRWEASVWDTVPVWRIEQRFGGVTMATWVDEDGLTVKAESPLGFVIERTTFELAHQEWEAAQGDVAMRAGYGAMIEGTAIASNVDIRGLQATPQLRVRLAGVDLDGFDLSGGRQSLHADTLVITREDTAAIRLAGYTLPWLGGGEARQELSATPLIQSDDPRIRRKAMAVTRLTHDPAQASRLLTEWVYAAVHKEITPSIPSAIQVLEAMRGDCNEHTVLYVALARSIGLPARTAVGLVNVRGRFYYHAWPEVWLHGDWVAVDPTLGQYPADASHIRFVVGGLARQVELIRLIGRLRIEAL